MVYESRIPDNTLETLARSLHREGLSYGFGKLDFVRFVNLLLDVAIKDVRPPGDGPSAPEAGAPGPDTALPRGGLPWESGRIRLRAPAGESDKALLRRWLEDAYGRYFLLTCSDARFADCDDLLAGPGTTLAIIELCDGQPIGAMAYLNHDPLQRKAELRKIIGEPDARGHGYAKEATALWIRYGFELLDLRKIYLDTLDTNLRNIRLNESLGFVVEGILRNEILLDGCERDVLRMGLCRPER